ncbi:hypothetical protein RRG08_014611 [Elysia crispata]|uniref:Uncharacterized protein n=1 Tax=Elysia crispata TaxID=231223 RepID=A0AAE0YRW1_9GAST|nr:hypothetical protein RRG08_014611 [Elysia crispata]
MRDGGVWDRQGRGSPHVGRRSLGPVILEIYGHKSRPRLSTRETSGSNPTNPALLPAIGCDQRFQYTVYWTIVSLVMTQHQGIAPRCKTNHAQLPGPFECTSLHPQTESIRVYPDTGCRVPNEQQPL